MFFFHYYQVGRKVKTWIKKAPVSDRRTEEENYPPVAPPRVKRSKKLEDGMHEIDLNDESVA